MVSRLGMLIIGLCIGLFFADFSTFNSYKQAAKAQPVKTEPVTVQAEPVEPELRWYDDVSNESRCYYLSTNSTNISCAYLVGGASK